MGRHERRRDVSRFRHDVRGDHIVTHLLDVHCDFSRHPLLARALAFWRSNIRARRPYCPACKRNYADDDVVPGAILFGVPAHAPDVASVTMFCSECATLPIEDIERVSARVLSVVVPGGRFEPLDARR
jgi:hypothetical protein